MLQFLIPAAASLIGGAMQSRAASKAADAQSQAAQAGIEEQRRQFDEIQKLLASYVEAGTGAIGQFGPYQEAGAAAFEQQQALAGILGPEAQQQAISRISRSPFLRNQIEMGERALLQRAGATGGLRGGDMQAALMQFRPAMLQQAIEQQYGRLGGLAGTGLGVTEMLYRGGQASATNQAQAGQNMAGSIGNLLAQQGAARAGGIMGAASPFVQMAQLPMQMAGLNYARTGQFGIPGLFGGTPITQAANTYGTIPGSEQTLMLAQQDFGMPTYSDRRLKRDVRRISTRKDGLGVYSFEYVWGGGRHIGLMAQEVVNVYPEAVGSIGDFMTVNYSMIPEA